MGNDVAYGAVKVNAIIKSDCQVMLDPYINGVFMWCVTREKLYSETVRLVCPSGMRQKYRRNHL